MFLPRKRFVRSRDGPTEGGRAAARAEVDRGAPNNPEELGGVLRVLEAEPLQAQRPETPKISPPTAHPLASTSTPPGHGAPMSGSDVGANGCAVGGDILGVSGPQNPKNSSIWIEKWLRNGSGTARETAEFRPHPRPALLLEVINDRGESHFHRIRHRGGPALPTPGCPEGRFVSRVRFCGTPSIYVLRGSHANGAF